MDTNEDREEMWRDTVSNSIKQVRKQIRNDPHLDRTYLTESTQSFDCINHRLGTLPSSMIMIIQADYMLDLGLT